jgi:hypothetical protein
MHTSAVAIVICVVAWADLLGIVIELVGFDGQCELRDRPSSPLYTRYLSSNRDRLNYVFLCVSKGVGLMFRGHTRDFQPRPTPGNERTRG